MSLSTIGHHREQGGFDEVALQLPAPRAAALSGEFQCAVPGWAAGKVARSANTVAVFAAGAQKQEIGNANCGFDDHDDAGSPEHGC